MTRQLRRQSPQRRRRVRDLAILAQLPSLARLCKRHRDCVFVHIQADVDDTLLMTRLLCLRLGAGPSSATLVNLHIEPLAKRVTNAV